MSDRNLSCGRVIAVASGKGGVGKTLITANLALHVARRLESANKRVVAIDLDLGCGNLNACLGVKYPPCAINDFLFDRVGSLDEVLIPTCQSNLYLVSCSYDGSELIRLDEGLKQRLIDGLRHLGADLIFVDLGAGVSADVLDLYIASDEKLLISVPESLALHNAFVLLKSSVYRLLWREFEREKALHPIKKKFADIVNSNGVLSLEQVVARLRAWDKYSSYIVEGLVSELKPKLVLNMCRDRTERKYLINFCNLVKKYLSIEMEYLGQVDHNEEVRASTNALKPFVLNYPNASASKNLEWIASRIARPASRFRPRLVL